MIERHSQVCDALRHLTAVRHKVLSLPEAFKRIELAERLGIESVPCSGLWQGALSRACVRGVSACDTLFVELADRTGVPLVPYDQRVLEEFPKVARRPSALIE